MAKLSAAPGAVLGLAVALASQTRVPFAGTSTGLDGKPLGNAQVVCAWVPLDLEYGPPDRREATSDAQGRFATDLIAGNAYVVWAIGPAGPGGLREVMTPRDEAPGRPHVELRTNLELGPTKLDVRGTAPWLAEGPLALRILVARGVSLGPDVPIPGDGEIKLPPLPSDTFAVSLVDGRGQPIESRVAESVPHAVIEWTPPRTVAIEAVDEDGRAVAGVCILTEHDVRMGPVRLLEIEAAALHHGERTIATTDADGRATARIPWRDEANNVLLFARKAGHGTAFVGLWNRARYGAPETVPDDPKEPVRFVLPAGERTTVAVRNQRDADRVGVRFQTFHRWWHPRLGGGSVHQTEGLPAAGDTFWCSPSTSSGRARAVFAGFRAQVVPLRIAAAVEGNTTPLPDLDLAALRHLRVRAESRDGAPISGAIVVVTTARPDLHPDQLPRVATDANGRAELLVADGAQGVYATTREAHGRVLVSDAAGARELRIVMEPLATATLRIVDAADAPVASARLQGKASFAAGDRDDPARAHLAALAAANLSGRLAPLRTDRDGRVTVHFPAPPGAVYQIVASHGGRKSDPIDLRAGDEVQTLRLK